MKKVIKFLLGLAVGLVIFYFVIEKTGLTTLKRAKDLFFSFEGLAIIGISSLGVLVDITRWKVILDCHGEKKSFWDLGRIWLVGFFFTYLTPVSTIGGEAARIYLTEKLLNVEWEKNFSTTIIDKILDITFHLLFLIVGLIIFFTYGNFPTFWILFTVLFVIFWLAAVLTIFYSRAISKKSIILWFVDLLGIEKTEVKSTKKGELIFNVEGNVLRFFSPKKLFFWKGVLLGFLKHLLFYAKAFILVYFIAGNFEAIKSLAILGLSYLSMLIPIPAGLGGFEAIAGFGFETLSLSFGNGTVFAMNWRAADLVICLLGFIFGIKIIFQLFKLKTFDFIDRIKEQ